MKREKLKDEPRLSSLSHAGGSPGNIFALAKSKLWLSALVVAILTFCIYLPALQNDFIDLDDPQFILNNYHITSFDRDFFHWAFTNRETQWSPLRWVSHAIDYRIWGLNPLGHHLSSVIIHSINAFLVLLLVAMLASVACRKDMDARSGGMIYITAFVTGLLFGIHPIHIESVVWVSERKDVLYVCFSLLSLISYAKYCNSGAGGRKTAAYLLSLLCFLFAGMSKAMSVTVPLIMILLDIYPFERIHLKKIFDTKYVVFLEKAPFILISVAVTLINLNVHEEIGFLAPLNAYPATARIAVAFKSVMVYLWRIVWPFHLAPFVPYPAEISPLSIDYVGSFLLTGMMVILFSYLWSKGKKVWMILLISYIALLLPSLLVKVSTNYIADRYVYMASILPFLAAGIGTAQLAGKRFGKKVFFYMKTISMIIILSAITIVFSISTIKQSATWENSFKLWSTLIQKDKQSPGVYLKLGNSYFNEMDLQNASRYYLKTIKVARAEQNEVFLYEALYRLGFMYFLYEKTPEAEYVLKNFEKLNPGHYKFRVLKGYSQCLNEDYQRSTETFEDVLKNEYLLSIYDKASVYSLLGDSNRGMGQDDKALKSYSKALEIFSLLPAPYHGIAKIFMKQGDLHNAEKYLRLALNIDHKNIKALSDLADVLLIMGKGPAKAFPFADRAVSLSPPFYDPYLVMGTVLIAMGKEKDAEVYFTRAEELKSPPYLIVFSKAWGYSLKGDTARQTQYLGVLLNMKNVPKNISENAMKIIAQKGK